MSLIVQKYGGTSVGNIERIKAVAAKVCKFRQQGHDIVVVVSAMSGETNRLIGLAKEIQKSPDPRELDVLVSTGEQVTIALLCMALMELGQDARSYTGAQVKILTDDAYTKARIQEIDVERMRADLQAGRVVVVAGSATCCWKARRRRSPPAAPISATSPAIGTSSRRSSYSRTA